jgi:hypothetical protein
MTTKRALRKRIRRFKGIAIEQWDKLVTAGESIKELAADLQAKSEEYERSETNFNDLSIKYFRSEEELHQKTAELDGAKGECEAMRKLAADWKQLAGEDRIRLVDALTEKADLEHRLNVVDDRNKRLVESCNHVNVERDTLTAENAKLREVMSEIATDMQNRHVAVIKWKQLLCSALATQSDPPVEEPTMPTVEPVKRLTVRDGKLWYDGVEATVHNQTISPISCLFAHLKENTHRHEIIVNGERIPVVLSMFEADEPQKESE